MKINELDMRPLFNGRCYVLLHPFQYKVNDFVITVPEGFITDLASVPSFLWPLFPPFGRYTIAAVVHDFLYSEYNCLNINRTLADKIFLFIMKEMNVSCVKRLMMYQAVRTFGAMSWKKKTNVSEQPYEDVAIVDHSEEAKIYYKEMNKKLGF